MPEALRTKLAGMLVEIARTPEVREKLFQQGWQMVATSPEGLANRVQKDTQESPTAHREAETAKAHRG